MNRLMTRISDMKFMIHVLCRISDLCYYVLMLLLSHVIELCISRFVESVVESVCVYASARFLEGFLLRFKHYLFCCSFWLKFRCTLWSNASKPLLSVSALP